MPAVITATVVTLEEENNLRAGELLTAYGSIATEMKDKATIAMTTDAMLAVAAEQSKLPRAMFVFYLHMGMGKIHWREEVDPINDRITDREFFFI